MMNKNYHKSLSDGQLVSLVQNGDQDAMGELYERYFLVVFNKCLSFTKNREDANDLSQDVMIRVMEKIYSFKGESKFSTWLYTITSNYCTDQLRKTKGKYFEDFDSLYEMADSSHRDRAHSIEQAERERFAGAALSSISTEDQEILMLKYQSNKSIEDLQKIYKLSASAVKMRLLRARSKAQDFYTSHLQTAA